MDQNRDQDSSQAAAIDAVLPQTAVTEAAQKAAFGGAENIVDFPKNNVSVVLPVEAPTPTILGADAPLEGAVPVTPTQETPQGLTASNTETPVESAPFAPVQEASIQVSPTVETPGVIPPNPANPTTTEDKLSIASFLNPVGAPPAPAEAATSTPLTAEAVAQPVESNILTVNPNPTNAIAEDVARIVALGGVSATEGTTTAAPQAAAPEQPVVSEIVPTVAASADFPAPSVPDNSTPVETALPTEVPITPIPETNASVIPNADTAIPNTEVPVSVLPTSEIHEGVKEPEPTEELAAELAEFKKDIALQLETKKTNLVTLQAEITELEEANEAADDPKLVPVLKFMNRRKMHDEEKMAA